MERLTLAQLREECAAGTLKLVAPNPTCSPDSRHWRGNEWRQTCDGKKPHPGTRSWSSSCCKCTERQPNRRQPDTRSAMRAIASEFHDCRRIKSILTITWRSLNKSLRIRSSGRNPVPSIWSCSYLGKRELPWIKWRWLRRGTTTEWRQKFLKLTNWRQRHTDRGSGARRERETIHTSSGRCSPRKVWIIGSRPRERPETTSAFEKMFCVNTSSRMYPVK